MTFPNLLNEICDFLKNYHLNLSQTTRDGRLNSAFNEDEILEIILQNGFNVNRPNIRDWIDFSFEENGKFYPVNIKVTTTKTADNLNCKLGIYYALTGTLPNFGNGISWENYFKNLSENLRENNSDYYFLIVNKENPSDIFISSLKTLQKINANGNNLPFQARWDDNRIPQTRNYNEAKKFILSVFGESLKLRADAYFSFKNYFGEFA